MDWTAVVVGALGAAGMGVGGWAQVSARRVDKPTADATAAKVLVETARGLVTDLQARVVELEAAQERCLAETAELATEVGQLKAALAEAIEGRQNL